MVGSPLFFLAKVLVFFLLVVICVPALGCCCYLCCIRKLRQRRSFFSRGASPTNDSDEAEGLVYVYQYNPDDETFILSPEGQNGFPTNLEDINEQDIAARQAAAAGGVYRGQNGRVYFIPPIDSNHAPYYDEEPPKYEDIVDLTLLDGGGGGSHDQNTSSLSNYQSNLEPYRDDVGGNGEEISRV